MLRDPLFYALAAMTAAGMIILAWVYPQGLGDRSPAPFGREPVQRSAEFQAYIRKATQENYDKRVRAERERAAAVAGPSAQPTSPAPPAAAPTTLAPAAPPPVAVEPASPGLRPPQQ